MAPRRSQPPPSLLLLLCALSVLVRGALGLYEDQAGTFDWHRSFVGHVSRSPVPGGSGAAGGGAGPALASFHRSKPRLFAASQQGVVASLSLRDGGLMWRHRDLAGEQAPPCAQMLQDHVFVTLAPGAVRGWDSQRGLLLWEHRLLQSAAAAVPGVGAERAAQQQQHRPAMAALPGSSPRAVAVLAAGRLQTFQVEDGREEGSVELGSAALPAGGSDVLTLLQGAEGGATVAFAYVPGSQELRRVAVDGRSVETQTLLAAAPLSAVSAIGPAGFAAVSADRTKLCTTGLEGGRVECTPVASLAPGAASQAQPPQLLQLTATSSGFALTAESTGGAWAVLLQSSSKGVSVLSTLEGVTAVSPAQVAPSGAEYVVAASVSGAGGVALRYVATATGEQASSEGPVMGVASDRLAPGSVPPVPRSAVLGVFTKKDGSDGFRVLLVWSDERLSLLQQGRAIWGRDEALAGVRSALFADLPASKDAAADAAEGGGGGGGGGSSKLAQFVQAQLLSAKVQFKMASPAEVAAFADVKAALADRTAPTRDARGFRKLILLTTDAGKVVALHNGDGHAQWARPFPADRTPQHLLQWQLLHDLTHSPRVAALHAGADGAQLSVLETHSGALLEQTQLPGRWDKVVSIGTIAAAEGVEQSVYLAVGAPPAPAAAGGAAASLPVKLLPDTPATRDFFSKQHRSLFFWVESKAARLAPSSHDAPALQGYGFSRAAAEAALAGAPMRAERVWDLAFAQPMLTLAARDPTEPTYSVVKVLGDRSVKYRYLNPNTAVVVTGTPPGVYVDPGQQDALQATIFVVDLASGQVLHQQVQPAARGPAAAAISDNKALVQLWDAPAARFTVTSLELFDATPREFSASAVLDVLFNPNASQPLSSFSPPPLEVLSASFFTRTPARAYRVTRTRAGITSKQLLALTTNDQMYALDQRLLDPRRPKHAKLTAEEMEEQLMPYQDTLPVTTLGFISLDKQVLGLRDAITAPSRLESTSLVFSWGVDLQFTRVSPARGFDTLDEDFSYGLLLVALVGLSTASVLAHFTTKASKLAARWQ